MKAKLVWPRGWLSSCRAVTQIEHQSTKQLLILSSSCPNSSSGDLSSMAGKVYPLQHLLSPLISVLFVCTRKHCLPDLHIQLCFGVSMVLTPHKWD